MEIATEPDTANRNTAIPSPDDTRAPDDAPIDPAVVSDDGDGAEAREGSVPPSSVPTREDIRRQIMSLLDAGEITERDVLADIHASLYHTELMLMEFRQHFESFRHSGIGRMLTRKAEKEARRAGQE